MRRQGWRAWTVAWAFLLSGCATGPLVDNPAIFRPEPGITVENPVFVPLGPTPSSYGLVFEKVLTVVGEYFEIAYSNRYDGQIRTFPRIAPGLERFWKPGDPDFYQRLEATLQTIRHRAEISIDTAPDGGYFVSVIVYKELEDLARPTRSTFGAASFRSEFTVERQYEVIDLTVFESNWIPLGRDPVLEQVLLQRLKKCM